MSNRGLQVSDDRIQELRTYLAKNQNKLAYGVPEHAKKYLTPERLTRLMLAAAIKTPALAGCSPESIVNAAMQAAMYGLEPGGALQEAALVPYGGVCTFMLMYRGLCTLAMREDAVRQIDAFVVYKGERYLWREGLDPTFEHYPDVEKEPGEVIFSYAIARLPDGGKKLCVVSRFDLEKAKSKSKKRDGSPNPAWIEWYEEMAKKVAIKRLLKTVRLTPRVAEAIEEDSATDAIETAAPSDTPTRITAARARVLEKAAISVKDASGGEVDPELPGIPPREPGADDEGAA